MRTRWTDERLDDFAETLRPLPAEVAALRGDVSATQRQMAQIGWAMAVGLSGTAAALIVALLA